MFISISIIDNVGVEDFIEKAQELVYLREKKILKALVKKLDKASGKRDKDDRFDDVLDEQERQNTIGVADEEEKRIKILNSKNSKPNS